MVKDNKNNSLSLLCEGIRLHMIDIWLPEHRRYSATNTRPVIRARAALGRGVYSWGVHSRRAEKNKLSEGDKNCPYTRMCGRSRQESSQRKGACLRERTAENEVTDLLERLRHLAGHSGSFAFVLEAMEASEGACTWGRRDFQNGNHKEPKGGTREAVRASPAGQKLPDDTWPWMEGVRHQGWAASDPLELRV